MQPAWPFSHWHSIRRGLVATIQSFEAGELSTAPFPGAWSAGQIMLHIANAEDGWLRHVVTHELPAWPEDYLLASYPDKAAILELLEQIHARSLAYLARLTESDFTRRISTPWGTELELGWIFWHIIEHEIHHRGELSLILGWLGREGLEV